MPPLSGNPAIRRNYGTPCKHEHACIRCPSLRVDPRARPRLVEIIANLRDHIDEALANGWTGEVEGLQISLNAAGAKLAGLDRMNMRSGHFSLGDRVLVISAAGRAREARVAARQAAKEAALTHDVNKEMLRPSKRARRPAAGGRLYRPGIVPISHPRESQEFP
ncbi:MAG: hypothetical protein QOC62_4929 [Mycobacterium sp.]|jgi:hypothetical protein|nr:hypothetical protein [Mycobacterium sp.]